MADSNINYNGVADSTYSADDAQALLDIADILDEEADGIEKVIIEAGEQIQDETQEEVAVINKAAADADDLANKIASATSSDGPS